MYYINYIFIFLIFLDSITMGFHHDGRILYIAEVALSVVDVALDYWSSSLQLEACYKHVDVMFMIHHLDHVNVLILCSGRF